MIGVVIPTIRGREASLERTIEAYERTCSSVNIMVVHDEPSCGSAWQIGAEEVAGDWLHLTADDIEPLEGWAEAAIEVYGRGDLPAGPVWRPAGDLESCRGWELWGEDGEVADLARVPFCSMDDWRRRISPMIPTQYYSDDWFTFRASSLGRRPTIDHRYQFVHHRPATMRMGEHQRMIADQIEYERYVRDGYRP